MSTQEIPSVSCVICHHQGSLVLKAIASLKRQRNIQIEIIVVTSDRSRVFYDAKTMHVPGGPDRKRNESLKLCKFDLIAFFDDDIEAEPTCVYEMSKKFKDLQVGMVFGKTLNMEHRDTFDEAGSFLTWTGFLWARGDRQKDTGQFDHCEPVLAGKSASCMVRRSTFAKVGMFDTSYEILGEESDLAWRTWLRGFKVLYVPRSVAFHAFNTKFKPIDFYTHSRVYLNGCRNYLSMLFTNLSGPNLVRILPVHGLFWVVAAFSQILTGKFKAGLYIILGISQFLKRLPRLLHKRKLVQSSRVISDDKLFKIVMRNPSWKYYAKRLVSYCKTGLHG